MSKPRSMTKDAAIRIQKTAAKTTTGVRKGRFAARATSTVAKNTNGK